MTLWRATGMLVAVVFLWALAGCADGPSFPRVYDVKPITRSILTPAQQAEAVAELDKAEKNHAAEAERAISSNEN